MWTFYDNSPNINMKKLFISSKNWNHGIEKSFYLNSNFNLNKIHLLELFKGQNIKIRKKLWDLNLK